MCLGVSSLNIPRTQTFDISATYTDFAAIYKSLSVQKTPLPAISNADPEVPTGYQSVFGPVTAANSAPFVSKSSCRVRLWTHKSKYMGFDTLDTYDVQACAVACNAAVPDVKGGYCQYFNIWQAVINGTVAQTVCAKVLALPLFFPLELMFISSTTFLQTRLQRPILATMGLPSQSRAVTLANRFCLKEPLKVSAARYLLRKEATDATRKHTQGGSEHLTQEATSTQSSTITISFLSPSSETLGHRSAVLQQTHSMERWLHQHHWQPRLVPPMSLGSTIEASTRPSQGSPTIYPFWRLFGTGKR